MQIAAAEAAIANENFVSGAFVRAKAKDALDGAFRHVDNLLDALEKFGRLSRISEALIAFARDQVGGVTLGQEDQIGIKRSALGADADDSRAVADQAFGRGVGEDGHAMTYRCLSEVMIVNGPQDRIAMPESVRITIGHSQQTMTIRGKDAALDQPALPG